MSALPQIQPIASRVIQPPVYRNERIRNFQLWYRDNEPEITRYFNDLKPYAAEGTEPACDFFEFAAIQHEREELKQVLPHGESL